MGMDVVVADAATTMLNGLDVSDPTRSFTPDEWSMLQKGNHLSYITSLRNSGNRGRGRGRGGRYGNRGGRGGRGSRGERNDSRNVSTVNSELTEEVGGDVLTAPSTGTGRGGRSSQRGGRGGALFGGNRYEQHK